MIRPDPYFLHTDIGHDPDDAIALSYLIEHNWIPGTICVTPGFDQQVQFVREQFVVDEKEHCEIREL